MILMTIQELDKLFRDNGLILSERMVRYVHAGTARLAADKARIIAQKTGTSLESWLWPREHKNVYLPHLYIEKEQNRASNS